MPRKSDRATAVAFDPRAPRGESVQALGELQKAHTPRSLTDLLLPQQDMRQVIDYIRRDFEEQDFNKSLASNVVPFPSKNAKGRKDGMQSVRLDNLQITAMGDYWEKPTVFGFDAMREMVDATPVLSAVVMTRVRQVQRFCHVNESGIGPGFTIKHVEKDHQPTAEEKQSIALLNKFFSNCGWEFNPRERKKLYREAFPQMMAKSVRDSLTMDSAPIETEMRRNAALGISGFYAVDGATIRLCTEQGYEGNDKIFAVQVVQGRISSAYRFDDLIYEARNPTSSVLSCGYGLGETELMVRVVTGFLNAMTYNIKGFDSNAIPKGMLHLVGDYDKDDLAAFKRYWNAMVKGVNNAWALPVMVAKDKDSKAEFERFGVEFDEMYFSKWMTFLTSIICAIYGMSPTEINFDSFTGGNTSALSGSDTEEKLTASKDSGLWPIMSYYSGLFSDYIVSSFADKYCFRWTGLDDEDAAVREERARLVLTVDEIRAQDNYGAHPNPQIGAAPVNQTLNGIYMQLLQAEQQPEEDFGDEGAPGGQQGGGQQQEDQQGGPGQEQPAPGDQQEQQPFEASGIPLEQQAGGGQDMQKAHGLGLPNV